MELIIGFLNSVLVPVLFIVGLLGVIAAAIAFVSDTAARQPRPWKYLIWVALYWAVVVGGWGVVNVLYGAVVA